MGMPAVSYQEECWHCGICWMECLKRAVDITCPASFWQSLNMEAFCTLLEAKILVEG